LAMRRFEQIEEAIASRWGDNPAVKICRVILDYVASKSTCESLMITYGDINKMTGMRYDLDELQQAITILVSRFNALELHLAFVDELERTFYLEEDDVKDFFETGKIAHPESGETITDAKDRTYPYYVAFPSSMLEEVAAQ